MTGLALAALLPAAAAMSIAQSTAGLPKGLHWQVLQFMDMEPEPETHACRISDGEACGVESLPKGGHSRIYPGGMTECISPKFREFSFEVIPRDLDKVLLFFEGGGACWDRLSTAVGACNKVDGTMRRLHGVLSDHADNPFKDYTVVFVTACSGDLHSGNVSSHPYLYKKSEFKQRGYYNTKSAVDWIKSSLNKEKLTNFVVMGESAGAIASQVWAGYLLKEIRYDTASVIADAYVGSFPESFQGPVFKLLGTCDTGVLDWNPVLVRNCRAETINIQDCFEAAMRAFPNVHFGSMTGKFDERQVAYYNLASQSRGGKGNQTKANFRRAVTSTISRFSHYPNHASFLVTTGWHTFSTILFEKGPVSDQAFGGRPDFHRHMGEWLKQFDTHDTTKSWCEVLSGEHFTKIFMKEMGYGEDYCAPEEGQTFTIG